MLCDLVKEWQSKKIGLVEKTKEKMGKLEHKRNIKRILKPRMKEVKPRMKEVKPSMKNVLKDSPFSMTVHEVNMHGKIRSGYERIGRLLYFLPTHSTNTWGTC